MARGDKTLAAMRDNPRDWRIASLNRSPPPPV